MKEGLKQHLDPIISLSAKEWKAIEDRLRVRELKKGEVLQEKDKPSRDMHFVLQGALRSFLVKDGEEITWNFYFQTGIATDFQSFLHEKPSPLTFVAIDKSVVVSLSKSEIPELYKIAPGLMKIEALFAERAFLDMRSRMESFLLQSAEERYLSLMKNNSELIRKLPNKDIATYLGIAPQSLSRIKARLFKAK